MLLIFEHFEGELLLFTILWRQYWAIEPSLTDKECLELEDLLMMVDTLWNEGRLEETIHLHRTLARRLGGLQRRSTEAQH